MLPIWKIHHFCKLCRIYRCGTKIQNSRQNPKSQSLQITISHKTTNKIILSNKVQWQSGFAQNYSCSHLLHHPQSWRCKETQQANWQRPYSSRGFQPTSYLPTVNRILVPTTTKCKNGKTEFLMLSHFWGHWFIVQLDQRGLFVIADISQHSSTGGSVLFQTGVFFSIKNAKLGLFWPVLAIFCTFWCASYGPK